MIRDNDADDAGDDKRLHIVGLVGSSRHGSYNQALYDSTVALAPGGMRVSQVAIADLPHFRQEIETSPHLPEPMALFWERLRLADALVIVTPEYNHSIPGVLKNALDWASRPQGDSKIAGKPAALLGASTGTFGSARAQLHLRAIAGALNLQVLPQPAVLVSHCESKFDESGRLTDDATRKQIVALWSAFDRWIRALRSIPRA